MTDDREGDDAADWLSAQFGSHEPDDPKATDPDAAENTAARASDAAESGKDAGGSESVESDTAQRARDADATPGRMPTAPATPATPPAPAPPPAASSGGFSWGLTPRAASEEPASTEPPISSPLTPPAEPPPLVSPPPLTPPTAAPTAPPAAAAPPAADVPTPPIASSPADDPTTGAALTEPAVAEPATEAKSHRWPFSRHHDAAEATEESEQPGAHHAQGTPEQPEPFDASLGGPPSSEAEPPTMALPWESARTELFTPVAASDAVAEPATELLSGFGTVPADAAAGSSIDSLFGESQFRDYDAEAAAPLNPFTHSVPAAAPSKPERLPIPRSQKALLWIAGALAALLVLIALFYLGTKIPQSAAAPAPTPTATKSSTPSPTPTTAAVGPLAPGTYKWDRLLGGECLAPFDSPWAEKFTVVDCATPHPAQMVAHGVFTEPTAAATDSEAPATPSVGGQASASSYPGVPALQAQINLLCSAPAVIDFAAAGAYTDIQFTASYPATEKQWADDDHSYYCFVTRSSGEPLTTSVAVPPAAPAA